MRFINTAIANAENLVPNAVDMVTALHALVYLEMILMILFGIKGPCKKFMMLIIALQNHQELQ